MDAVCDSVGTDVMLGIRHRGTREWWCRNEVDNHRSSALRTHQPSNLLTLVNQPVTLSSSNTSVHVHLPTHSTHSLYVNCVYVYGLLLGFNDDDAFVLLFYPLCMIALCMCCLSGV